MGSQQSTEVLREAIRRALDDDTATIVETHISVVGFGKDRVLKAKKPHRFEFVDQTDPEARRQLCALEVELNRRLAPDVYLGVVDLFDCAGHVIDAAVEMRRLDRRYRLSSLIEDGIEVSSCLADVARQVAGLHAGQDRSPAADREASYEAVKALWRDGLDQIRPHVGTIVPADEDEQIRHLVWRYLEGRSQLFADRIREGRAVDGHGDLLADDIFCEPDGTRAIDCLEFSDRFRLGDGLIDVAFLAMDLEHRDRPDLAREFLDTYCRLVADRWPSSLERFYVAYRAHVRAKVGCVRVAQGDTSRAEQVRSLHHLAVDALTTGRVRLIILGGLPGTGKSTIAAELGARHGWPVIDSDVIRKQRFGLNPWRRPASHQLPHLYGQASTEATYEELFDRAEVLLHHGSSVILDASWNSAGHRRTARDLANRTASDLFEVQCTVSTETAHRRLGERVLAASDADQAVYDDMKSRFDPWPEATLVETDAKVEESLAEVEHLTA